MKAETSIQAYLEHIKSGKAKTQREKVLACVQYVGALSREQISDITGIRLASVCGRANELLEINALTERETIKSQFSGHRVKLLEAV